MRKLRITVNGNAYDVMVEELNGSTTSAPVVNTAPVQQTAPVASAPKQESVPAAQAADLSSKSAAPKAGDEKIDSPMPGTIIDIKVNSGDTVKKGQVLLVLEAMKMENEIVSPRDAVVSGIYVSKGESVDTGKTLASIQ